MRAESEEISVDTRELLDVLGLVVCSPRRFLNILEFPFFGEVRLARNVGKKIKSLREENFDLLKRITQSGSVFYFLMKGKHFSFRFQWHKAKAT